MPFGAQVVTMVEPDSIVEAVEIMRASDGQAKYLSGGTALVLLVKMRMLAPETLVSLRGIRDLGGWGQIGVTDSAVTIGGGVTLAQIAEHPVIGRDLPSLAHAASVVGNIRIRNAATIGGMLAEADYASDPPATLSSLGGSVVISAGVRERTMLVQDFITDFFTTALGPEEIVTGISIPRPAPGTRSVYLKFSSRSAEDRPCVGVAACGRFEGQDLAGLRVVVGAVAGRPQWFPEITAPYCGRRLTDVDIQTIAEAHADSIDPIADIRGSEWYRREVVLGQVSRALLRIRDLEVA